MITFYLIRQETQTLWAKLKTESTKKRGVCNNLICLRCFITKLFFFFVFFLLGFWRSGNGSVKRSSWSVIIFVSKIGSFGNPACLNKIAEIYICILNWVFCRGFYFRIYLKRCIFLLSVFIQNFKIELHNMQIIKTEMHVSRVI